MRTGVQETRFWVTSSTGTQRCRHRSGAGMLTINEMRETGVRSQIQTLVWSENGKWWNSPTFHRRRQDVEGRWSGWVVEKVPTRDRWFPENSAGRLAGGLSGRTSNWTEVNYGSEKNDVRRIAVNRGKHSTRIAITRFFKLWWLSQTMVSRQSGK